MRIGSTDFREVWAVDFEFSVPRGSGERPKPICLVAKELSSGRTLRIWEDELQRLDRPPYPVDQDCLLIAYYASAEIGCHLALGWPVPANVLDLFTEFRNLTNGLPTPCGRGLLGALVYFALDAMAAQEKDTMRDLAILTNASLILADGRIDWIGPTSQLPPLPPDAEIIDAFYVDRENRVAAGVRAQNRGQFVRRRQRR